MSRPADSRTQAGPDATSAAPVSIGMGAVGVGRDGATLRTFLGSCVGLALFDRRRKIAGLAHIVLPDSRGQGTPPGKYADTAVRHTIAALEALAGGGPLHLVAKLAGGAKMFPFQTGLTVGDQNVQAVERLLAEAGIAIVGRCCGGEHGRHMTLEVATCMVWIDTVGSADRITL